MSQVVLLTGAAGNLGKVAADRLLDSGASLALVDHAEGRLDALYPALASSKEHLLLGGVDLGNGPAIQAAVVQVLERLGRVDALVHTVGGYREAAIADTDDAFWRSVLELNFGTALHAIQAVLPVMRGRHAGRIVIVSGTAALAGARHQAAYSAAKAAVLRLVESVAAELGPSGIHANAVMPGTMDTPQNRKDMAPDKIAELVPLEAVADVIGFLCSPAARGLNGVALPVLAKK